MRRLFSKIIADTRHVGCEILHERWVPARTYKAFGMSIGKHDVFVALKSSAHQSTSAEAAQGGPQDQLLRLKYESDLVAQFGQKHAQHVLNSIVTVRLASAPPPCPHQCSPLRLCHVRGTLL